MRSLKAIKICISHCFLEIVRDFLMKAGKLVIKNPNSAGMNRCAAYESKDFVVKELLGKFALVDFIPGSEDRRLGQDVYLAKKY